MPDNFDPHRTIFAKTALGQQEIQSRTLGLSPIVRRALVLVDGKRSADELSVFMVGKGDIAEILVQLLELGCIEAIGHAAAGSSKSAAAPAQAVSASVPAEDPAAMPADAVTDIPGLPPPGARSAKDNEMARNFMINSVNAIIGQNMRITLITDIHHAQGTDGLRKIYRAWEASMSDHGAGSRRLPELREKLFKVL